MQIEIQMGPNFPKVVAELGALGPAVIKAAGAGLAKGVKYAASRVASDYLTGQALKRRTGLLAKSIDGWMEGVLDAVVGVRKPSAVGRYKWLLGDEQMTITPKRSKFLAIPIAEGLTAAGVARYASPRQVEGGFFVRTGGKLLFGYKRGKKGKFRPLFTLVKSVLVQGSGALADGVTDSLDDITETMETEMSKVAP